MKKIFKIGCLFVLGISILSFIIGGIATSLDPNSAKDEDSLSEVSSNTSTQIPAEPKINTDSVVKVFRPDFTFKKDEFENRTWVEPKNRPKYTNVNKIFCYFQLNDKKVSNFRLCIQYTADDWLFIKKITFNIDGDRNIIYIPQKMERDNNSTIWEWCDDQIDNKYEFLISAIANAKKVKVKFDGQQYYDIRILSSAEIKYIKKTYDFYLALGGKF